MQRRTLTAVVAGLTLTALALTDCTSGSSSNGDSTPKSDVKTGPGVTDTTIKLGYLTDLTGPFAPVGAGYLAGVQLYLDALNKNGGVCNRQVELDIVDHGYDVQRAVTGYRKIRNDVVGIASILGGGVANTLLPETVKDNMVTSYYAWTQSLLNGSSTFLLGGTYEVNATNVGDWAIKQFNVKSGDSIAVVSFAGEVGDAVAHAANALATEYKLTVKDIRVNPTDTDFTGVISNLKSDNVKLVFVLPSAAQVGTLVSQAAAASYDAQWILPVPGSFDATLLDGPAKAQLEQRLWIGSGQAPYTADSEAAKKVRTLFEASDAKVPPQMAILSGYAQAQIWDNLLKASCSAGDLSREGVMNVFKTLKNVDTGGLLVPLDFTRGKDKSQSLSTMILRPDSSSKGGLKLYKEAFSSSVAEKNF